MNSCLYDTDIIHYRTEPKTYRFTHKSFMFYVDLDELPELDRKFWLFGYNRRSLFRFNDKDHIEIQSQSVKKNILEYVSRQGIQTEIHRVMLLTNVRIAGYIFNPVCFYYCFDTNDRPVCAVAEVGNTFGELKPFFLGPETFEKQTFQSVQKKYYYISPFIDLEVPMDFQLKIPGERLMIRVDDLKKNGRLLYATMKGRRKEMTSSSLLWHAIRFPFETLRVIFLIHYHAAVLHFVKKIPYHKKNDNPDLQREVYRVCKKTK